MRKDWTELTSVIRDADGSHVERWMDDSKWREHIANNPTVEWSVLIFNGSGEVFATYRKGCGITWNTRYVRGGLLTSPKRPWRGRLARLIAGEE